MYIVLLHGMLFTHIQLNNFTDTLARFFIFCIALHFHHSYALFCLPPEDNLPKAAQPQQIWLLLTPSCHSFPHFPLAVPAVFIYLMFKRTQPDISSDDAGLSKRRRTQVHTIVSSSNNTLRHIRLIQKRNGKLAQCHKTTKKANPPPIPDVDPDEEIDEWVNELPDDTPPDAIPEGKLNTSKKSKKKRKKTLKVNHFRFLEDSLMVLMIICLTGQPCGLSVIQGHLFGRVASTRRSWGLNGFDQMSLVWPRGGKIQMYWLFQSAVTLSGVHCRGSCGSTPAPHSGFFFLVCFKFS